MSDLHGVWVFFHAEGDDFDDAARNVMAVLPDWSDGTPDEFDCWVIFKEGYAAWVNQDDGVDPHWPGQFAPAQPLTWLEEVAARREAMYA